MISDFLCFSLRLCFIHVLLLRTADTSETTMDLCSMKLDAKLKHFHRSQLESIERSAWDVWQCFRLKKNIAISDLNVASSQNHKKNIKSSSNWKLHNLNKTFIFEETKAAQLCFNWIEISLQLLSDLMFNFHINEPLHVCHEWMQEP